MSAEPAWTLRPLAPQDLDELMRLQAHCFDGDFLESAAVYSRRLSCGQHQSLALSCDKTQALRAYAAAYWSDLGKVTPFDGDFLAPTTDAAVLYLHDVSVAPEWAGRGAASSLVSALFQRARAQGVRMAALVSVQGLQAYWARHGFAERTLSDPEQQGHLLTYGHGASYMVAAI